MRSDEGLGRIVGAIAGAVMAFCLVGWAVFYKVARVGSQGVHGGPVDLSAAMAGLFAGGLAAVAVLVLVLRFARRGGRDGGD